MSTSDRPSYADPDVYRDLAGFEGDWRESWWNADFLKLIGERFDLGGRRDVLDVGCGAGHWGRVLLPHLHAEARLVGVDREPAFLDLAREQAQEKDLQSRCSYAEGLAEVLPFNDHSFDVVTCQTVLIHVEQPEVALREMGRVLRPGGVLIVAEPDNIATTAGLYNTSVPLDADAFLSLLELQMIFERGKRQAGEGDNSIGAHLPALLAGAGLRDVRAYGSDKCAMQLPPYQVADQAIDLREQLRFAGQDFWLQTGTEDDTRRLFVAGGGEASRFAGHWEHVKAWLRAFEDQVARRTFSATRGVTMYVVGGLAPQQAPGGDCS